MWEHWCKTCEAVIEDWWFERDALTLKLYPNSLFVKASLAGWCIEPCPEDYEMPYELGFYAAFVTSSPFTAYYEGELGGSHCANRETCPSCSAYRQPVRFGFRMFLNQDPKVRILLDDEGHPISKGQRQLTKSDCRYIWVGSNRRRRSDQDSKAGLAGCVGTD